jgi:pimeloyl-ACP methyl ester carboxylesterase
MRVSFCGIIPEERAKPLGSKPVGKEDGMPQEESVTSNDGTPIAYWRSGQGPPLVLVHGTTADHGRWAPVVPAFQQHFTVYAIDRRGRGGSGDPEDYAIRQEFEDVAAVVDSLGEPAFLLGHSYGALCALEAALLTRNVRKLVLYEPPMDVTGYGIAPPEVIDRLEALLEAGDRDGVVASMLREVAGVPPEAVEYMRSLPAWQARVAAAHTIPRELRAPEAYRFDAERFGDLEVPTLLLIGSESPATFEEAEKAVAEALPNSRIIVMHGQGHVAMDTATALFTSEVIQFLEDP